MKKAARKRQRMTNIEVFDEDIGKRLDVFVSEREDITRAFAQKLIEDGGVLVLGAKTTH